MSSDRRGGVWLTGSAWSLRGLLINDRDGVLTPRLTPDVKGICQTFFTSADTGWMVDGHSLWKSTDAGLSWQRVTIPDLKHITTFQFYDSQNGWVGGGAGEIHRTTDAGQTWARAELPLKYQVKEIRFVDPVKGWAVGYYYTSPTQQRMSALFRTDDGGRHWRELSNVDTDSQGGVRSLFFLNRRTGWGIGTRKRDVVQTNDGGETWTVSFSGGESRWNSVFFADDRRGWAVGSGIAYTSDGGATWSYQVHPVLAPYLESIIFTDGKHGWAAGPSVVLRTNDGGKTWRELPDSWKNQIPGPQSLLNERF